MSHANVEEPTVPPSPLSVGSLFCLCVGSLFFPPSSTFLIEEVLGSRNLLIANVNRSTQKPSGHLSRPAGRWWPFWTFKDLVRGCTKMASSSMLKDDILMTHDRWEGGRRVSPWDTGEGLVLLESMAKKQKESVSGRVVHIIKEVFQMYGTQICPPILFFWFWLKRFCGF